ncbi:18963_t:CDS:2, partial [Gigaspora margarita]
ARTVWKEIRNENETIIRQKIQLYLATEPTISSQLDGPDIAAKNAVDQNDTIAKIKEATQRISDEKRLGKLKRHAKAQAKLRAKKQKQLEDEAYLEPQHKHIFAACHYYHPAKVSLASVARTDMKQYIDGHYCLASVKAARVFAEVFASDTIIISQDDKAKIGLGVPVVGHIFKTMQSTNEPVTIEDYDFLKESKMKLIPLVYLVIDPADSNTMLCSEQLAIFIRPEYFVSTSSSIHMDDLLSLVDNQEFVSVLLCKNKTLDLDYLTIHMHAPYQSAYNPVERSMAFLSEKLAGITLPVDEYGVHPDSQGNIVDEELAWHNFEFLGNQLSSDAALLLDQNDGFLPPITKGMNGHFIDLIHALQYFDKLKIQLYDRSCPSISNEMYQHLCCSKYAGEPSLEAGLLNFRVAEDIVGCNHKEEISNLYDLQSNKECESILF